MTITTWALKVAKPKRDWAAVADLLREHEGMWGLIEEQAPISAVNSLRQGSVRALRRADGFVVKTENTITDENGRIFADLWMSYKPIER